jgi:hypothetical protein
VFVWFHLFFPLVGGGGGGAHSRALSREGEEADDVDIRQWILANDCDVGHQMYTDNDIMSLVLSEKSGQDDSNESDSDEATTEVISHTEGLEALERALLYVEQHSKATPTDVIFMKRWRDIAPLLIVQHFIRRK